jgi:putative PIN family toxin of toxin-antitoxin system
VRAILDTNILISGLISPSGKPARLIDAWLDGRFSLVSHALQLDEFRAVSRRDRIRPLLRPGEAGRLVNRIAALAEMPAQLPFVRRSSDPHDDFLLALCEAGAADVLVTGDKADLLVLKTHASARIISAAQLASELDV